jgi:SH3 domain protein
MLFLFSGTSHAETVRYVSDDLTIPMRSGTTNRHKILAFLNSGTAVKVLQQTDDGGYTRVFVDDKEGWVQTDKLMNNRSARDRLVTANQKLDDSKQQIATLRQNIAELKQQNQQLEDSRKQLQEDNNRLQATLVELRTTAANPIAIHEQNQQLEATIDEISARNESLMSENARLNDNSLKEWFIIGAVVAIGSLLLGLIIPNIKWRKKDSWAGSF